MQFRRQHIVPRLVPEHFTDQKGHVWTYDKKGSGPRNAVPEQTAVIAHFYSRERDDGSMDTALEEALNKFESEPNKPYDKLINGEIVAGENKAAMASFLAVVRTPTYPRLQRRHTQCRLLCTLQRRRQSQVR